MKTNTCQNCKNDFSIEPDDFSFYEKIQVPPPTFCPQCRMIRRFAFRNQKKLFKTKDFFTKEEIFSLIPPESGVSVTTSSEWFGDKWDGIDKGVEVDFSLPFLSQLFDLHKKIPQLNLNTARVVESPYSGNANDLKNCYLIFNAAGDEDCMYGLGNYNCKHCVDNCDIYNSEFCYENFWVKNCTQTHFSEECVQCSKVMFSKNCVGCLDCVGCVNLRNKSYCIFNEQYDKESYQEEIIKLRLDTFDGVRQLKEKSQTFWKTFPKKFYQGIKNSNSNGAYVTTSKNVKESYVVEGGEDLKYCQYISQPTNKDCYDISVWGDGSELSYEYSSCGSGVYNSKFIVDCWPNIRDVEYSLHCNSSSNLFGCVGLRNKEYCILNKQYSKEEYTTLVEKIKKHMADMPYLDSKGLSYSYGEFFPIEFSWYGYNNTMAQEFFPLTSDEARSVGYPWYEVPKGDYVADINAEDLPSRIEDTQSDIVKKIIECETCHSMYRIQNEEFTFLKRENLPIPHSCPDCRYNKRISKRVKPQLYNRKCMKEGCVNEFKTGYAPSSDDIIYCESCYQQEIV